MKLMAFLGVALTFTLPAKAIWIYGTLDCPPYSSEVAVSASTALDFWDIYWWGLHATSAIVQVQGPPGTEQDFGDGWEFTPAFAATSISSPVAGTYHYFSWHLAGGWYALGPFNCEVEGSNDPTPVISLITPDTWNAGTGPAVQIQGSGFGNNVPWNVNDHLSITGGITASLISWSDSSISAIMNVPSNAPTQMVYVSVTSTGYNGMGFQQNPGGQGPTTTQTAQVLAAPPPSVTFSAANASQEVGKSTHFIGLVGCSGGSILVSASISPNVNPGSISWSGGSPGVTAFQRNVDCGNAADTDLTLSIAGAGSYAAKVHVLAASTPPAAVVNAPKTHSLAGTLSLPVTAFGGVAVAIGTQGVAAPTYNIDSFFSGDRWVFRLRDVTHLYKMAIQSRGRIDLPNGNPATFPLVPGFSLQDSHTLARNDLDTSNLPPDSGPARFNYWVEFITQVHEEAHISDFYGYWQNHMGLFESEDVEGGAVNVVYDCQNSATTSGGAAVNQWTPTWNNSIAQRHETAYNEFQVAGPEVVAHTVSNPMYVPIRAAIPIP